MEKMRCGICGATNGLFDVEHVKPGDLFECGWCCGLTVVAVVGDRLGMTRRRRGQESGEGWKLSGWV